MKKITWEWRGRIMTDLFIFPWLQFSKHLDGGKHWSWTFHWKGSSAFWYNFKRKYDRVTTMRFSRTKLTLRLGTNIIVFGGVDMKRYYRDVQVLEVKTGGKVTYQFIPALNQATFDVESLFQNLEKPEVPKPPDWVHEEIEKMKKDYWHLNKDYPDNTWRN